jgi:hypothetical protein
MNMSDYETGMDPTDCEAYIKNHKESIERFSKMSEEESIQYLIDLKKKANENDLARKKSMKPTENVPNPEEPGDMTDDAS